MFIPDLLSCSFIEQNASDVAAALRNVFSGYGPCKYLQLGMNLNKNKKANLCK